MKPPRPFLSPIARPGRWAVVGLFTAFAISVVAIAAPLPAGSSLFCLILILIIFFAGAFMDARARAKRLISDLLQRGYEPCPPDLIDPDITAAAEAMRPWRLLTRHRTLLLTGESRGRTVWIASYAIPAGKSQIRMSLVAVQTLRAWPPAIIRRRNLLDQFSDARDLNHRAFDAQREMRSDHPDAITQLAPLADWFITDDTARKKFRLHEIPGKREQWSFRGNWALLATPGLAKPRDFLQLTDLLTAFAEAADDLADPPTDPAPTAA